MAAIRISPLELILDDKNPRFVILGNRQQSEIRKYLVTYEDVCQLACDINSYGRLLPGERIIVLYENNHYVVVEGNRRTCSLQMLLSRNLIPNGFAHKIPATTEAIIKNCSQIEVDVLPDRNSALALMSKRHIEGVKQWKPLAKKQFFAVNFNDGAGQSVKALSEITGISEGKIKEDIRDYKFFHSALLQYASTHPNFSAETITLKPNLFWRIFQAKFHHPETGSEIAPRQFLKMTCDEQYNTISALPYDLFQAISQMVFEQAVVFESISTRNVLTDVKEITPLLHAVLTAPIDDSSVPTPFFEDRGKSASATSPIESHNNSSNAMSPSAHSENNAATSDASPPLDPAPASDSSASSEKFPPVEKASEQQQTKDGKTGSPSSNAAKAGGPPPRAFFETLNWRKLTPSNPDHNGLILALNELHRLSRFDCRKQRAYKTFPIASGMVLRTAYEQALILRLKQLNLWSAYCQSRSGKILTLSSIEKFINSGTDKKAVFPDSELMRAFNAVISASHRDFLNSNIHSPGNISVTSDSLEAIAQGGMYSLIQGIINLA